jgi:hypothetical protein
VNKGILIKVVLPTIIGGSIGWLVGVIEIGLGVGFVVGLGIYYKVFDD